VYGLPVAGSKLGRELGMKDLCWKACMVVGGISLWVSVDFAAPFLAAAFVILAMD